MEVFIDPETAGRDKGSKNNMGHQYVMYSPRYLTNRLSSPVRYTACSFRGVEDRLPYDSMLRLNNQSGSRHCSTNHLDSISKHGSTQRLESKSQHSSIRDLSNITQAIQSAPGNRIHRVLEENGATA